MALNRRTRPAPPVDDDDADGFNHAEQRALEGLRKVARQWPGTLMLYADANAGTLVALRVADLDTYLAAGGELPAGLPSEKFGAIISDGGRPN